MAGKPRVQKVSPGVKGAFRTVTPDDIQAGGARLPGTHHFQIEMARMTSEKRTFAAAESFSVPSTMRIAHDSNSA